MSKQKALVAKTTDLHLSFRVPPQRSWSVRQEFVDFLTNPVEKIMQARDRFHVLRGINLKIHEGDRIAILGRNGAGKTTLARCLAGIYHPQIGKVDINGKVRAVFETSAGLYPDLSGRENIRVLLRFLYPQFAQEYDSIESDIVSFSGLGTHADSPYRIYSNGMQARLGLALVTSRPCELIILDEVFDGADRFFREKMQSRLSNFLQGAKAVIFISHSREQILDICNRSIVLEDGKLIFDGSLEDGLKIYDTLESRE